MTPAGCPMQPASSTQLDFGHRSGHAPPVEGERGLRPRLVGALLAGGCAVGVAVVVQRAMQGIDRGVGQRLEGEELSHGGPSRHRQLLGPVTRGRR